MVILISPAKGFNKTPRPAVELPTTEPLFAKDAAQIAAIAQKLSEAEMKYAFKLSDAMAARTLKVWNDYPHAKELPALLGYNGMVFKHIDAASFDAAAWRSACDSLLICSPLYGLVRPLDRIKPYRMEGMIKLKGAAPDGVFEFWQERLTDFLIVYVQDRGGVLHYLGSEEMKRLFDWKRVAANVEVLEYDFTPINPDGSRGKQIVVYTKMQRGDTARRLILNHAHHPN